MRAPFGCRMAARFTSPVSSRSPLKSRANRQQPLATILTDHEVTLAGEDDAPDRYGRQPAFVFPGYSGRLVQSLNFWRKARRWFPPP